MGNSIALMQALTNETICIVVHQWDRCFRRFNHSGSHTFSSLVELWEETKRFVGTMNFAWRTCEAILPDETSNKINADSQLHHRLILETKWIYNAHFFCKFYALKILRLRTGKYSSFMSTMWLKTHFSFQVAGSAALETIVREGVCVECVNHSFIWCDLRVLLKTFFISQEIFPAMHLPASLPFASFPRNILLMPTIDFLLSQFR